MYANANRKKKTMSESDVKDMKVQTIMTEVADVIAKSGGAVRNQLVAAMVKKEQDSRVSLLDSLLQKRITFMAELKKTSRPDVITYDSEDKEAGSFSKARRDGNKKLTEKVQKLDNAIEKALLAGTPASSSEAWDKLRDLAKKL